MWVALLALIGLGIYYVLPSRVSYEAQTTPPASIGEMKTSVSGNPNIPVGVPKTSTSAATAAKEVSIAIQNFAFAPARIVVTRGSKVTWENNDSVSHTVTADSGNTPHSQTLSHGQSYSVTFTERGTFSYHCSFHPGMTGEVVVQ